jgi:hypothetical protein
LPQHGLALGREEFEAGDPRGEWVMTQLVMTEEGLIGVQTSHGFIINL